MDNCQFQLEPRRHQDRCRKHRRFHRHHRLPGDGWDHQFVALEGWREIDYLKFDESLGINFDENLARVWQCWAIVEKREGTFGGPLIVRKSVPWRFKVEEEDSEERHCQVFFIEKQLNNCYLQ